jgi:hypothetical protein
LAGIKQVENGLFLGGGIQKSLAEKHGLKNLECLAEDHHMDSKNSKSIWLFKKSLAEKHGFQKIWNA